MLAFNVSIKQSVDYLTTRATDGLVSVLIVGSVVQPVLWLLQLFVF